jgi:hypothetical protein
MRAARPGGRRAGAPSTGACKTSPSAPRGCAPTPGSRFRAATRWSAASGSTSCGRRSAWPRSSTPSATTTRPSARAHTNAAAEHGLALVRFTEADTDERLIVQLAIQLRRETTDKH